MHNSLIDAITKNITGREINLLQADYAANQPQLAAEVAGKSALVIGGAGSIGARFIGELVALDLQRLYVVDTNENDLTELVRDIRSTADRATLEVKTYALNFSDPLFARIFQEQGPFDIVANFAAHKHVRSEKDAFAIQAMFENNFFHASRLLNLLAQRPPRHFFCVSTDKATRPVSIMGATKLLMEKLILAYRSQIKVTTARFANVAFSKGSLLDSYIHRYEKGQALVCPVDIDRYFVSPGEAGKFCLLACILGESGDIFTPNLSPETDLIPFSRTVEEFLRALDLEIDPCQSEQEAREKMKSWQPGHTSYPVYLFETDTDGEKSFEEFYAAGDEVDADRFDQVRVVKRGNVPAENLEELVKSAEKMFRENVSKAQIVEFLEAHLPAFQHAGTGKSLDQKM